MHRTLQIEDILRYVFRFLIEDPPGPQQRSLANLAITCRTFLLPALEVLWFDLPSIGHLVMRLPEDSWEEVTDVRGRPRLVHFFPFLVKLWCV
jgi:hypothetical protein